MDHPLLNKKATSKGYYASFNCAMFGKEIGDTSYNDITYQCTDLDTLVDHITKSDPSFPIKFVPETNPKGLVGWVVDPDDPEYIVAVIVEASSVAGASLDGVGEVVPANNVQG